MIKKPLKKTLCHKCKKEFELGIWVTRLEPPAFFCEKCYYQRCNSEEKVQDFSREDTEGE